MYWQWFIDNLWQIIINIMGGIVVAILTALYFYLGRKCWQVKFKQIFGDNVTIPNSFHLVYGEFTLSPSIITFLANSGITHPYQKPISNNMFSISRPVSIAEVRSSNYLSSAIGSQVKNTPVLSSDIGIIKDRLDLSFVSFGGPAGNYKTNDILTNDANRLINFDQGNSQMISVTSKKPILTTSSLS